MMFRSLGAAMLVLSVATPALAQQSTGTQQDVRQQAEAWINRWQDAINKGDVNAVVNMVDPNGCTINATGGLACGRQKIQERVESAIKRGPTYTMRVAEARPIGNEGAAAVGQYTITYRNPPAGTPPRVEGYWLRVLARQGDDWKSLASSFTPDLSRMATQISRAQPTAGSGTSYAQQASDQAGQQPGPHQGLSQRYVKQIQSRLRQQGYYDGRPTGTWDEDTSDALQNFQDANGLQPAGDLDGMTILVLDIPVPPTGPQSQQQQQALQGGRPGPQDRSMMGQMDRSMMGQTGQTDRSTTGQGDQSRLMDAYQAGYRHGLEQGFKQTQAALAAMGQGQGTAQGSSQPPQQYRGGQQQ